MAILLYSSNIILYESLLSKTFCLGWGRESRIQLQDSRCAPLALTNQTSARQASVRPISKIAKTTENFVLPLSVSKTQVNKQLWLITTNSQICKLKTMPIANVGYMIVPIHTVAKECWDSTSVISVLLE